MFPRSGDVLRVTRAASVQFSVPITFRVIRVHDWQTYDGWVWLDGYQLNDAGEAVERRSIFVQLIGLAIEPGTARQEPTRRTANTGTHCGPSANIKAGPAARRLAVASSNRS